MKRLKNQHGNVQNHKLLGERAKSEILKWAKRQLSGKGHVTNGLNAVEVACRLFNHEWMTPDEAWGRLAAAHRRMSQLTARADAPVSSPADADFYSSAAWHHVRFECLAASDKHCVLCGRGREHGVILEVDHIKPRSLFPELALTLTNLQCMCHDCNRGKGNRDQTDWRSESVKAKTRPQ